MTFKTKVKKFKECLLKTRNEEGFDFNAASALAHSKYGLNAAWNDDQQAWFEAIDLAKGV